MNLFVKKILNVEETMGNTQTINKHTSLFLLTWPIFVELFLQMLIGNVDQFMISRYSENAVAAIGNVNQIMNLLTITFSIISMATTIMVSQYLGSQNKDEVSKLYSLAVFCNLAFSVVIGGIILGSNEWMFKVMQLPQELYQDAKIYISIVGGFVFLQAVFMTYGAIFRSNGLMKQTMFISMAINIINVVGNIIFLTGLFGLPELGVTGVALSSVISRFIGVVLVIRLFIKKIQVTVSLKYLRPFPTDLFKQLMKIGLPSAGESISYNVAQMWILTCVNRMGTYVVTTRVYANMLAWFSFIYSSALSSATQIIVGHLVGAGEEDDAEEVINKTLLPTIGITLVASIAIYFASDIILGMFTDDPMIIELGKKIMFIEIFLEAGRTVNLIIIRALQAAGDIKFPVTLGICSMWGIAGLFAYILGLELGLGLVGVWIAMAADECFRAVCVYIRWKKGKWRGRAFVKC